MSVYVYAGGLYCKDCGESIRKQLTAEGRTPAAPDDVWSYSSEEFPKGPYPDGGGEADFPQHCESEERCVNAIELSDGSKVGAWLGNELTTAGVAHVQEAIAKGGEVAGMWKEFYWAHNLN